MNNSIYTALVNKTHPVAEDFLEHIILVSAKGTKEREFLIEEETYKAYLALADFVEKQENIRIGIGNAYRSVEDQQAIYERFCGEFGIEYANAIVAPVGKSEHHTGLGVDLELYFDGEGFISNNKNFERICPVFETHVHPHLAKFGFILRYEKGKEAITGYPYEPWHIRYVGTETAEAILQSGLTMDEWSVTSSQ